MPPNHVRIAILAPLGRPPPQGTIDTLFLSCCRLFLPLCHFTLDLAHLPFRYRRSVGLCENYRIAHPCPGLFTYTCKTLASLLMYLLLGYHTPPHRAHFLSMTYIYPSITILLPSLVYFALELVLCPGVSTPSFVWFDLLSRAGLPLKDLRCSQPSHHHDFHHSTTIPMACI